jgi:recombination protein RecR
MNYSSKLIEEAVQALATLPSIGKKTALRLVLHLVKMDPEWTERLGAALLNMRRNIQFCQDCHHLSDGPLCQICSDSRRDRTVICVVEGIRDVMAIEETGQFKGLYHVLGGVISPLDGIGPEALHLDTLLQRVASGAVGEIIMAVSPTIEGETTIFYLSRQLQTYPVKISVIARGVSFGGELEYADELTLGRSITARAPYKSEGA